MRMSLLNHRNNYPFIQVSSFFCIWHGYSDDYEVVEIEEGWFGPVTIGAAGLHDSKLVGGKAFTC